MSPDIVTRIKSMEIRGAREIALASLKYLRSYGIKKGFGCGFRKECQRLLAARPTAVPLHNIVQELKRPSAEKIDKLILSLETAPEKIASYGRMILKKRSVLMTHCHSTEDMIFFIKNRRRISKIFVTETRPRYQGYITTHDLIKNKIKACLIVDSACGFYMPEVDAVFVGADAIRKEGFVNKIGTLPLAITAMAFRKPFYVVADSFKFDRRPKIKIEMRPPTEIRSGIKGGKILNPAFDITPWKYVTKVVTEHGLLSSQQIVRILKR